MSRNESFSLRKLVEELTYEMFEELNNEELEVPTIEVASNYYIDYAFMRQFSLVDTDNYSLWDDEENNITAKEKALKAIYENTSNLEKMLSAYNKVLQRKLKVYEMLKEEDFPLTMNPESMASSEEVEKRLKDLMGETDLDKPNEFDNRRFEGE